MALRLKYTENKLKIYNLRNLREKNFPERESRATASKLAKTSQELPDFPHGDTEITEIFY